MKGIRFGVSRDEYERMPAINFSALKHIAKSPAHFLHEKNTGGLRTEAMASGAMNHVAVLEPEIFEADYPEPPDFPKQGKENIAAWAIFEEKNAHMIGHTKAGKRWAISAETRANAAGMRDSIWREPLARRLLIDPNGKNEVCVTWEDDQTGVLCKALLDRITPLDDEPIVIDFKTTAGFATPRAFEREIANYQYHCQAAWYLWGLEQAGLSNGAIPFWFLVVEKSPPFCSRAMVLATEAIALGRDIMRRHLDLYVQCRDADEWPAYPSTAPVVSLPQWAFREELEQ